MKKKLEHEALYFEREKEEVHRFHRICSKELPTTHNSPWAFSLIAILRRNSK
jgi:hypothetical protein